MSKPCFQLVFNELLENPSATAGVAIADTFPYLEQLANDKGFRSLVDFTDTRTLPANFKGDFVDAQSIVGPREDWYDLAEGLEVIDRHLKELTKQPSEIPMLKIYIMNLVVDELLAWRFQIQSIAAEHHGVTFRIEIGFAE